MRAPAVSFAHKIAAATLAASLTFTLVPFAHADGEGSNAIEDEAVASGLPDQPNDSIEPSLGEPQEVSAEQDTEGSPVAPMLASGLVGKPSAFINSDVALDSEPVVGSFTVDGLTFAVAEGSTAELVGVSEKARTSARPPVDSEAEADAGTLVLSESVSYGGADYILASIAPYAFYLSGVASVTLPASVNDVDDRAFCSSDVASVTVADGNQTYSSFDGALYDADQLSLLLIPEGKQGAVLLPKTAEVAEASVFSHCPLVDSISVEEDGAAFASENGLLYDASLTTLLRVPAGATEITIRDGCTTIAAGALEACAKLERINAPASVTSISPDVFTAIPTVSLLAASLTGTDDPGVPGEPSSQSAVPQLFALVTLSSTDDDLPKVNPAFIQVALIEGADDSLWQMRGFSTLFAPNASSISNAATARAVGRLLNLYGNGGRVYGIVANVPFEVVTWDSNIGAVYEIYFNGAAYSWTDTITGEVFHRAASRPGYTFKFWGTSSTATRGDVTFPFYLSKAYSNNAAFYAIWDIHVSWNPNGGNWGNNVNDTAVRTESALYGQSLSGPRDGSAPTRKGYRFAGWSLNAGASSGLNAPATSM